MSLSVSHRPLSEPAAMSILLDTNNVVPELHRKVQRLLIGAVQPWAQLRGAVAE